MSDVSVGEEGQLPVGTEEPHLDSLEILRQVVMTLEPAGNSGFEGLLAQVLRRITGYDFRRAKSGQQHGKDGSNDPRSATTIAFEGKRYDGPIPRNEILAKIPSLMASVDGPELWILGATVEIGTQLQDEVVVACTRAGIVPLFLDWPGASPVPPLAAACAMAPDETEAFLKANAKADVSQISAALDQIRSRPEFEPAAIRLRDELLNPWIGMPQAREANTKWLLERFQDRQKARSAFGQALSPLAQGPVPTQSRPDLIAQVHAAMSSPPSGEIFAILAAEGRGKSWLVAQSWLAMHDKPLLLYVPASRVTGAAPYGDLTQFLIERLIEQTGGRLDDRTQTRWARNLERWKNAEKREVPRFVIWVDGLNQNASPNWALWLQNAGQLAAELGGTLIATCRRAFFDERVKPAVMTGVTELEVPEWTDGEVAYVLAACGIGFGNLSQSTRQSLRNPRILGIALTQLKAGAIQDLAELSEARLLFEHMRHMAADGSLPETVPEFSRRLAAHAVEIVKRQQDQILDDLLVFDRLEAGSVPHRLDAALQAVISESFCSPLENDPTRYVISGDGLVLALGIWVTDNLKAAHRSHHDVSDRLSTILEPIEALDRSAAVVLAAATVSTLQDEEEEIVRVLLLAFVGLQNPDHSAYPAFAAAVRRAPGAAMKALGHAIGQKSGYVANKSWLDAAVRAARSEPGVWQAVRDHLEQWLRTYTLDPKVAMFKSRHSNSEAEIEAEQAECIGKLNTKLAALSASERLFLEKQMLRSDNSDSGALHREAYSLMTGMPIADFSQALIASRMSEALNSGYNRSWSDFVSLVQFNRIDWSETRAALLEASSFLKASDISEAGKWAYVSVLRACATPADASEDDGLVAELTKDRPSFQSWRLVERYCATDPCDPEALPPENIGETVSKANELDAQSFHRSRDQTEQDLFLNMALPGLVRFAPNAAASLLRRIANSIIGDFPNTQLFSVHKLKAHCSALEVDALEALRDFGCYDLDPNNQPGEEGSEKRLAQEQALILALAHLNGDDQLEALCNIKPQRSPWLERSRFFQAADPAHLDATLQAALGANDENKLITILQYACNSGTVPSEASRGLIRALTASNPSVIRALALQWAAEFEDPDTLVAFARSDWSAAQLDPSKNHSEIWSGSWVLVLAAEHGFCDWRDTVNRITPELYGELVRRVGTPTHSGLADRLLLAFDKAMQADLPVAGPAVEQSSYMQPPLAAPRFKLSDQTETGDLEAFARALAETPTEFQARQKRNWDAFHQFEASLTRQGARLILEDVGQTAVDTLVSGTSDQGASIAARLLDIPSDQRGWFVNFAVRLACSLSSVDGSIAHDLLVAYVARRPTVRRISGLAEIDLQTISVWKSADCPQIDSLRKQRLDLAANDDLLAREVLAALVASKEAFLQRYVRSSLSNEQPSIVCRGLMVLGFGLEDPQSESAIADHLVTPGLIGRAAEAAKFAYDRNRWARHWYNQMHTASTNEAFWLNSVLFLRIVDARFDVWGKIEPGSSEILERFYPTISDSITKRTKRWKSKREKKLFGLEAPNEVFLGQG